MASSIVGYHELMINDIRATLSICEVNDAQIGVALTPVYLSCRSLLHQNEKRLKYWPKGIRFDGRNI